MNRYFKSLIEQDSADVVICDLNHRIIYMNPAALAQHGKDLTGECLFDCHGPRAVEAIKRVTQWFLADPAHNRVHTFFDAKENRDVYMIALRDETDKLIGYYEKFEYRDRDMTPLYEME